MADRATGYMFVSRSGNMIAANSRAHDLATRFRSAMGIQGERGAMAALATRAEELAARQSAWRRPADGPPSFLYMTTHALAKETSDLHEDVLLVVMNEVLLPKSAADELIERADLTPREQEIAPFLVHTPLLPKQIAAQLSCSPRTIETHADRIYHKLGEGRLELMVLAAK